MTSYPPSPARGGYSTADVPPEEFSLLWHGSQRAAGDGLQAEVRRRRQPDNQGMHEP